MRESEIEAKLKNAIENVGGKFFKFVSPGNDGVPDRIVILKGGKVLFVELKTSTGRLSPIQRYQIKKLEDLGCKVYVVKGPDEAEKFIEEVVRVGV